MSMCRQAIYRPTVIEEIVTYYAWNTDLTSAEWLDWDHARQIVRVKRHVFYKNTEKARARQLLNLVRIAHA